MNQLSEPVTAQFALRDTQGLSTAEVAEFLDGSVSHEQESAAAEHLATCEACTAEPTELESVTKLYRDHGMLELPDGGRRRIAESLGLVE